jgi:uncharacterized protein (DUF58 family)
MLTDLLNAQTLRTLEAFKLQSRRKQLGVRQGGHVSPRRGHGIEFSDYRNYEMGDDPRHIDWGVYARSDRLYIKRFQEEQDLSVYLLLDNSASLFVPRSEDKWRKLLQVAFSIAYVALMQDDSVHFIVPGERQPLACRSFPELHRICDMLLKLGPLADKSWSAEMLKAVYSFRFPGVAYVLSDLLFEQQEFYALIMALLAKNLDANVVRIASASDLHPFSGASNFYEAVDSESREKYKIDFNSQKARAYEALVSEHFDAIDLFLKKKGVGYAAFDSSGDVLSFVTRDLKSLGISQ